MKRVFWCTVAVAILGLVVYVAYVSHRIEQQSSREEARPADVILVLGAAELQFLAASPVANDRVVLR